jgi:hypothetical protein
MLVATAVVVTALRQFHYHYPEGLKAERHARLVVLYERFYLNVVDPGFLNPVSHISLY